MEEQIAVVDAQNRFLYWAGRHAIHEQRLIHRSVYVLVMDRAGRLLIQLRHRDKQTYPLHWDISCAGHVCAEDYHAGPDTELDQVYRLTAERELTEELGITAPLVHIGHMGPTDTHYEQTCLFRVESNGPITIQESEVEEIRWLDRSTFQARRQDHTVKWTQALRRVGLWAIDKKHW